jgi:hypothetical protein
MGECNISQGYHNKVPQTGCHKVTETYYLRVLEAASLKPAISRVMLPLKPAGRMHLAAPSFLVVVSNPRHSLATAASSQFLPMSSHDHLPSGVCVFYIYDSPIGLRRTLFLMAYLNLSAMILFLNKVIF